MSTAADPAAPRSLTPYAARLALDLAGRDVGTAVSLDGTLLKIDLSGFTRLSERLARSQTTGAEELTAVLDDLWTSLIEHVLDRDGDVLQFGGDALVVWFHGAEHGPRAAAAAWHMQQAVRARPAERTPAGPVRLRMSAGAASGRFTVGLVGEHHRELVVLGPAATQALDMEVAAGPGQVVLDRALALAVVAAGGRVVDRGDGALLRHCPEHGPVSRTASGGAAQAAQLLAPEVLELELAGVPLGEHRRVTVAFVHRGGTDELVTSEGGQAALEAAGRVASAVERAAADNAVCWTASDVAGGGVVYLLVGGAPVASEQDEERVLRAARAVVEACPEARVGVHTGRAFAGDVGHPERRTYAVLGDTTNTAARLMSRAAPGQVLTSRSTWERSEQDHAVDWLGALALKGRRGAVDTAAVGARREPSRLATHDLALIGRAAEVATLERQVADLGAGRARPLLLLGPAGQGKSRLVAAAGAAAHRAGHQVVVATADPYESASPYGAVRPALRRLLGLAGGADDATRVQGLAGPDQELAPLLALPLGVALPGSAAVAALDPQFVQRRRAELLTDVLQRTVNRPLLVVVEDLHVCDRATLDLLDALASHSASSRLAVLATGRTAPDGWPADAAGWERLDLAPLDRTAARSLVLEAAGDVALDDAELERLLDEAAGNPLFLRELVAWVDRAPSEGLPEDLDQVIASRIDTLPPRERALLRQCAVVGPVVDLALVAGLLHDEGLRRAERWAGLVDFVELVGDSARFRHDLYRRGAYTTLAVRRRRVLHAATAATLAALPNPDAAALAAHLHAAQDWSEAHRWAAQAASTARGQGALADALHLFEMALDAGRRAGEGAERLAALEEDLGDAADLLGRYRPAERALLRAGRAGTGAERIRRTVKRAAVVQREGRYRLALSLLTRAERELGPDGDAALRRAAWLRRSSTLHRCGRLQESAALARRTAQEAEAAGDLVDRARAMLRLDMVTSELGLPERFEVGRQALAAFEGVDEPRDLGSLLGNLGVTAYETDDWDEAVRLYAAAGEAYRRAGDAVGRAFAVNNLAEVQCDQGRLELAREGFLEARRVFRAAGHGFGIGCTASSLGRIAARTGDVESARALLRDALRELGGMPAFAADTAVRVAEVELLIGSAQAVERTAQVVAESRAPEVGPVVPLVARRYHAVALAQGGRHNEAVGALYEVLAEARRDRALYEVGSCLHHLADLGERDGEVERDGIWTRLGVVRAPDYGLGAAVRT